MEPHFMKHVFKNVNLSVTLKKKNNGYIIYAYNTLNDVVESYVWFKEYKDAIKEFNSYPECISRKIPFNR